jgi:hypothetical protein
MSNDILSYERMVERAMRSVVIDALGQVAEYGLPGTRHLYITFATKHPGVDIPGHLHEKFPEEMTIVLQHQFWDLILEDDRFMVNLSFNDIQERLIVPYAAIKAFADPSVNFGLQLKFDGEGDLTSPITLDESELDNTPTAEAAVETLPEVAAEDGANVVTLDAFRKK